MSSTSTLSTSTSTTSTTSTITTNLTMRSNLCSVSPCLNNGICVVNKLEYSCSCPAGYTGKNCENNPCSDLPCFNGGSCVSYGSAFKCICTTGFSGNRCEMTPCTAAPCVNGGSCSVSGSGYVCSTWKAYHWSECSVTCGKGYSQRYSLFDKLIEKFDFFFRSVVCLAGDQNVDDKNCGYKKPKSRKICHVGLCPRWKARKWSQCSEPCGGGQQSRLIYIVITGYL